MTTGGAMIGLGIGTAASGVYAMLAQDPSAAANGGLSLIERYGVFGLHSLIVLGIGVWMCKLLQKLNDSVVANTAATVQFAGKIDILSDGLSESEAEARKSHDEYRTARIQSVADMRAAIADAKTSIVEIKSDMRALEQRIITALETKKPL